MQLEEMLQTFGLFQKETNIRSPKCDSYSSTKRTKLYEILQQAIQVCDSTGQGTLTFKTTQYLEPSILKGKYDNDVMVLGTSKHY